MDDSRDALLDELVAEYADRVAHDPEASADDLVARVADEHRAALRRCFQMIRAGLVVAPGTAQAVGPGVVLDGYRIVREVGRGGMAVVWLAVQEDLERQVALKILRPGLAVEQRHVDRFRREALAIAKLKHPHIVQVFGVGEARGHHYIAMEYVDGSNLEHVLAAFSERAGWTAEDLAEAAGIPALAEGQESFERAFANLMAPVARAIGLAHELGLVHRDVKPSNILIHRDGRAVVADFGLAKGEDDPGLSLTGEPLGTPFYMSPEQASAASQRVDHRTDVYSLGVSLYQGLTGLRPFQGDTIFQVLEAIRTSLPSAPRNVRSAVSRDFEAVVLRAMERDPEDRYPTALDLYADLRALADGRPTAAGAEVGSGWRRFRRALRQMRTGYPVDYTSRSKFLGLPLVDIRAGRRLPGQRMRVAKGWIAVGDAAIGGLAMGGFSCGLISWGGIASGLFCWGGIGIGIAPFAGIAIGALAYGGVAVGYGAVGGIAIGVHAVGGAVYGLHTVGAGGADEAALQFVRTYMPWSTWFWGRWLVKGPATP
jgi:serine/threonine protein kinase